jgi:putative ABC transport system substrate-binding protein
MATQKTAKKVLGFLNTASAKELAQPLAAFHRGLKHAGYVDGRNLTIKYLWAKHDLARLPEMARKLADQYKFDVVAATGGLAAAQAAVEAIKDVPIVFVGGFDPAKAKLVDNNKRPSGNATGVSTSSTESLPDRLKLLKQLMPGTKIALLVRPGTAIAEVERQHADGAEVIEVSSAADLKKRFAEAKKGGYAVAVGADAFFTANRKQIAALAKQHKVATVYPFREYLEHGGLFSYGPSLTNCYRQAGIYAGQLLDNAKRTDLPVLQPPCFELAINLKAAKALGVEIPHEMHTRAGHVID